jgi:tetrahydromethanopterin S-methyltransferase subunit F
VPATRATHRSASAGSAIAAPTAPARCGRRSVQSKQGRVKARLIARGGRLVSGLHLALAIAVGVSFVVAVLAARTSRTQT